MSSGGPVRATIPIQYLIEMAARCRAPAATVRRALASAGLPHAALSRRRLRVSPAQFEGFYESMRRARDDELFGYLVRPVPPGAYATLVQLMASAADVSAALDAGARFYRLFDRHRYWSFEIGRSTATLRLLPRDAGQRDSIFFVHAMLLSAWRTAAWLAASPFALDAVQLPPRFRRYRAETRYLFGRDPTFAAGEPQLRFPAEAARLRVVRSADQAERYARGSLRMLLSSPPPTGLEQEVRAILSASRPIGDADIVEVARRIGASRATFARRLARLGTSFQQLKDEVRRDHAIALLAGTSAGIGEIAEQLGYSAASAFQRAFRDWTGTAPGAFRRAHR
jgi:AraC-like DNA-binding protein